MLKIQIFIGIVGVVFSLTTLELLRRRLLRPRYALVWAGMSAVTFFVALFPRLVAMAAQLTGMTYTSAVITLLFAFGALMLMNYSVIVSRQSNRIIRLTQEVAVLREQLERLVSASRANE